MTCVRFFLTLVLLTATLQAADPKFTKQVLTEKSAAWMGFDYADINGDGRLDLLVQDGGNGGPLYWFEAGEGDGPWKQHLIAEKGPDGVHFTGGDIGTGDFDQDGDMDALGFQSPGDWGSDKKKRRLGTFPSQIYIYENVDGRGTEWRPHLVGESPDLIKDVSVADFDGDGFPDLAILTYKDENTFCVFRNGGKAGEWNKTYSARLDGLHEGMDAGDIDGDGDPDIAANGYWIENPGGDLSKEWKARTVDPRWYSEKPDRKVRNDWRINATKIVCRDLTGDGRCEVIISHSEKGGKPVVWYESEDPRSDDKWKAHVIAEGFNAAHTLKADDIDGDGDIDVLVGENADADHAAIGDKDGISRVIIYLNDGTNEGWEPLVLSDGGLYNGHLVDLEGDGDLDIAGSPGHEGEPYFIWRNTGAF